MKYNMKGGLSLGGLSLDPSAIAATVAKTVMKDGSPLAVAVEAAKSLPQKIVQATDNLIDAKDAIPQLAADRSAEAARAAVDSQLAAAGITPGEGTPASNQPTNNTASNDSTNNTASNDSTNNTASNENMGEPSQNDPNSTNSGGNTTGAQEGGRYETLHLMKPPKDPLHVFYLDGRPIYFTDNGKGRVKILPMHTNMQMAKTSSRHKYTKKMKHKRKTRSTKKSRAKGVRKTSHKAKQRRSRRR